MLHDIAQHCILTSMQHSQTVNQSSPILIRTLIEAIYALDGLDHLPPDRLAAIISASHGLGDVVADFREAVTAVWEITREPADPDLELIESGDWDCGLIDWHDDPEPDQSGVETLPYGIDPDEFALEDGIDRVLSGPVAA